MSVFALVLAALGVNLWPTVVPETKVVTESQVRPVGPYWQAKAALTNEVTTRYLRFDASAKESRETVSALTGGGVRASDRIFAPRVRFRDECDGCGGVDKTKVKE